EGEERGRSFFRGKSPVLRPLFTPSPSSSALAHPPAFSTTCPSRERRENRVAHSRCADSASARGDRRRGCEPPPPRDPSSAASAPPDMAHVAARNGPGSRSTTP